MPRNRPLAIDLRWPLAVFALALVPRVLYVFFFSDPENPGDGPYMDAYHHWQIAYLTKEIGLAEGRLWDLKGVEYFWGVVHPLALDTLFALTGSTDIVVSRLLSSLAGAAVVALLFVLARRYWGTRVAVAAAVTCALLPVTVFNDAAGMEEQVAFALVLAGLALLPRHGFGAGAFWGLAAMTRAEMWLFTAGLVAVAMIFDRPQSYHRRLIAGWAVTVGAYMWFLWARTGNPIYPLYWNFFGNAAGTWISPRITDAQAAARPLLFVALAAACGGLAFTFKRRPQSVLLLTFGFAFAAFAAGFYVLTHFLSSWESWMWLSRHFEFVWEFAAVLLCAAVFGLATRVNRPHATVYSAAAIAALVVAAQLTWLPIGRTFSPTELEWTRARLAGTELSQAWRSHGESGSVNIPADHPDLTYALVRAGVDGKHITGQLYDPYLSRPGWHYADHQRTLDVQMRCWLQSTSTSLWLIPDRPEYVAFVQVHPDWFHFALKLGGYQWSAFWVDVPTVTGSECRAAAASAT